MADTQSSPVLVQHLSPAHTLSPEINTAPLVSPTSQIYRMEEQSIQPSVMDTPPQRESSGPEPEADTPMLEAQTIEPQPEPIMEAEPLNEREHIQNNQEQEQAPVENNQPIEPLPEPPTEPSVENIANEAPTAEEAISLPHEGTQPDPENEPSITQMEPEPPPLPEWVTWEDDFSVPSEEELKEFEGTDIHLSALDVAAHEKRMFKEWADPDQRPVKKIRLSWVIKGVRGTKERPNMARTMHSPAAFVDGKYWQIKFYPRGNKVDNISAYIRCTPNKPTPDSELPESTFSYFEGPPDANVGEGAEPKEVVKTEASPVKEDEKAEAEAHVPSSAQKGVDDDTVMEQPNATASQDAQEVLGIDSAQARIEEGSLTDPTNNDVEMEDDTPPPANNEAGFRVSAQLGMIIYNPEEPRTKTDMSSEHQFNQFNDDWGWTKFVGPWNEIHIRQRGQFQPLLRNDTLTIDAYILIFQDPTQALWWHESNDHESIWPSKKLVGYFPMGTGPLYHSPAVAGLTSWLLLEPFRKVLQGLESGKWRQDSQIRPRPLIASLQHVLHRMRHLTGDTYVKVEDPINALRDYNETYSDVVSFWEVLRRSIELEITDEPDAVTSLSKIFDVDGKRAKVPSLPVKGVQDIQQALEKVSLPSELQNSGPDYLPLVLNREVFDHTRREWKLHHDRVALNDEIELPGSRERYTLYGFVVHVGKRNSGRFYSILRPNGPGTKWLAFEDGDGNKVFSYTRSKLKEYEGFEDGEELSNSKLSRQTAYVAMYIKTSCLQQYLPGVLEEYRAPNWIGAALGYPYSVEEKTSEKRKPKDDDTFTDVEVYHDEGVIGRTGLLDMLNMKDQSFSGKHLTKYNFPPSMTFYEVRRQLAKDLEVDDVQKLRIFIMRNGTLGQFSNAQLETPRLKRTIGDKMTEVRPFCLWCSILKSEEAVKLFGYPEKKVVRAITSGSLAAGPTPPLPYEANAPPTTEGEQNGGTETVVAEAAQSLVTMTEPMFDLAEATEAIEAPTSPEAVMEDAPATQAVAEDPIPSQSVASTRPTSQQEEGSLVGITMPVHELVPMTTLQASDEVQTQTAMQEAPTETPIEEPSATATETAVPVEHGHLVDAVMSDGDNITLEGTGTPSSLPSLVSIDGPDSEAVVTETVRAVQQSQATPNEQEMAEANEAAIAALIAADSAAMDTLNQTNPSNPVDPANSSVQSQQPVAEGDSVLIPDSTVPPPPGVDTITLEAPVPPPPQHHPIRNVYGFLQIFDANKQDFTVHSTFFGKIDESVKDVMRRSLAYDKEKSFHAWHRESNLDGTAVSEKATFEDIKFIDGVDMVVGEVLTDEQVNKLRNEGKFSNPFALSRYLRLRERNHPTQAATTPEAIEICDFGSHYYCGPLVSGQPHGPNCTLITSQGHTYTGPFTMSKKSGPAGKMKYQNGDTYDGEWLNDERHGQGTFIEKRTGNKYVGGFANGKRWGKGTTHWEMADEEADICQICYGEDIDALFFDCGHVCACVECAKQCSVCPICRKEIKEVVRMFWA